jgi:hypothetical protein
MDSQTIAGRELLTMATLRLAVKCCVVNPLAQFFIMSQGTSSL